MHDPYTQILNLGPVTLWHKDPEKHGDDDSCGWFLRSYHGNKATMDKVVKEFEFNFKHNYWFHEDGTPVFSTIGIVLCMYRAAAWIVFNHKHWNRYNRFINKHLANIMHFAENPTDSLHTAITSEMYYRTVEHDRSIVESREDRIRHLASVVYGDIIRKLRPWYRHPRWHIHHWRFTFNIYNTTGVGNWLWRNFAKKIDNSPPVDNVLRDTV